MEVSCRLSTSVERPADVIDCLIMLRISAERSSGSYITNTEGNSGYGYEKSWGLLMVVRNSGKGQV